MSVCAVQIHWCNFRRTQCLDLTAFNTQNTAPSQMRSYPCIGGIRVRQRTRSEWVVGYESTVASDCCARHQPSSSPYSSTSLITYRASPIIATTEMFMPPPLLLLLLCTHIASIIHIHILYYCIYIYIYIVEVICHSSDGAALHDDIVSRSRSILLDEHND